MTRRFRHSRYCDDEDPALWQGRDRNPWRGSPPSLRGYPSRYRNDQDNEDDRLTRRRVGWQDWRDREAPRRARVAEVIDVSSGSSDSEGGSARGSQRVAQSRVQGAQDGGR
jgi:hypothetical protein